MANAFSEEARKRTSRKELWSSPIGLPSSRDWRPPLQRIQLALRHHRTRPAQWPAATMGAMSDIESRGEVPDLEQLEKEVEFTAYQASGPGGQHRNRTFSAIRAKHLPTGIVVTATDSRSQLRNRKIALERLRERLVEHFHEDPPRVPTRKRKAVREREKRERQRLVDKKKQRQKPDDV